MRRALLVFALLTTAAHAGPDKRKHALELAAESERAYKDGNFEKAADLLRKAHDTYAEPLLLYNLGRALEGMGDQQGAVDAYEQYLHDAKKIDDRPAIERRVATLKAQIEKVEKDKADADQAEKDRVAKEQADKAQADQTENDRLAKEQADRDRLAREQAAKAQPLPLPPPLAVDDDDDSAFHRIGPWATMGTGGALVITGLVFGSRANSNHDAAVTEPVGATAADLAESAKTDATIANVMFVAGGAVVVGGAIWEYIEWKRSLGRGLGATQPKEPVTHLRIAPNGIAIEWKLP
jgi:tetratricopeptide (TPR) repeat protein